MEIKTATTQSFKKNTVLCECDRRKGKLLHSREEGYIYKGGCIKDAICSKIVVLKHKQWRKRNKKLQKQGEVTIYEA